MRESEMRNRNSGVSLVEVIVVVLILGVMAAATTFGISFLRSMDASATAKELMALLEKTRLQTLAVEEGEAVSLELFEADNKYYARIKQGTTETDLVRLKGTGLTITVRATGTVPETVTEVKEGEAPVVFSYDKGNGAFTSDWNRVEFYGTKEQTLVLVTKTGRCYLE